MSADEKKPEVTPTATPIPKPTATLILFSAKEIRNIEILGNYRIIIFNTKNRIEFILLNPVLPYSLSLFKV